MKTIQNLFSLLFLLIILFGCNNSSSESLIKDSEEGITSFAFLKKYNPSLNEDVTCTISSNNIRGKLPHYLESYKLIPTFDFGGIEVVCDGKVQKSSETYNDFSTAKTYKVKLKSGAFITYNIHIDCPEPPNVSQIPVIRITTDGNMPITDKKSYRSGTITIEDPGKMYWEQTNWSAKMGIRGRGNSTWNMPKKPYKIKLDAAASIFGKGADKEWVLLANYTDKSLLRNVVAMKLSSIVGMNWTPIMLPVEVYLNGEYQGCYTFSEHKKVSNNRVNLNIVTEEDDSTDNISGDYYFEIEQNQDEATCWWTSRCKIPMMFIEPEYPTKNQLNYIKSYFADTEDALMGADFADPNTGYAKWIDVESFIKSYIVNELTKNIDGNMRKSSFITKKKGEKLVMYFLWDYDLTLGNCDYLNGEFYATNGPEGWFVKTCSYNEKLNPYNKSINWYTRLMDDPEFRKKVKEIWNKNIAELEKIPSYIDEQARILNSGAQQRNFEKWNILNQYVWPNYKVLGSYEGEVNWLKEFYTKRLKWLDTEINKW